MAALFGGGGGGGECSAPDTSHRNYCLQNPPEMDATEGNHTKQIKLGSERQLPCVFLPAVELKIYILTYM